MIRLYYVYYGQQNDFDRGWTIESMKAPLQKWSIRGGGGGGGGWPHALWDKVIICIPIEPVNVTISRCTRLKCPRLDCPHACKVPIRIITTPYRFILWALWPMLKHWRPDNPAMMAQWLGFRTVAISSPVSAVSSLGIGSLSHNWVPDITRWLCMELVLCAKYGCMWCMLPGELRCVLVWNRSKSGL